MSELVIDTYEKFAPLHDPEHPAYNERYQVYYGGRGGRKSWEAAQAVLVRGFLDKKLILCTREFQASMTDSVHRLLSDQIQALGLGWFYQIQKTTIIGKNGTQFVFKGLNSVTIDSLKSLEGADICWVEEAHSVSDESWRTLIPTIRKEGSQIFITFNPDLIDDPVYRRFVLNPPPGAWVKKVFYTENGDCPQTLIDEAEYLKKVDYEAYENIWLGEVRMHSNAQVFKGKYRVQSFIVDESFDAPLFGADWGFSSDPTAIVKCYIKGNTLYVAEEAFMVGCEIDHIPALFDSVTGSRDYKIRADSARPEIVSYIKRQNFNIVSVEKWSGCVQDRVDFMRMFEAIIIDPKCKHVIEEFRLYSFKTDKRTGDVLPDIIDKHNHGIDAIGYALTPIIRYKTQNWAM